MAIELIAKIAPKNDGFTGMVDADQVLGGGGSGTLPNACVAQSNVTQHETAIDHNSLTNYAIGEHRTINDVGTGATDLWSASKINTELGTKEATVTWGDGLQKVGATASVDLVANGGLKITATELEVDDANVDHNALANYVADEHINVKNSFAQNDNQSIATDEVRARDGDGLKLCEDGGDGLFVKDSTGYVGVKNTDPWYALDVFYSSDSASATNYPTFCIGNASIATHSFAGIFLEGNDGAVVGRHLLDGLGTSAVISDASPGYAIYTGTLHPLIFGTNNTEHMRIDASGNITVSGTVDGRDLATDGGKLDLIEAEADVTDATNVNAAGAVMEVDYDAHTILAATLNNTPVKLTVAEQTLVGRITSGNIAALTATQVRTLLNVEDGADVTDTANVTTAGAVMADGSVPLTADWNIGDDSKILADWFKARDSDGLRLTEDGDKGILIQDSTGNVGIDRLTPGAKLDIFDATNHLLFQATTERGGTDGIYMNLRHFSGSPASGDRPLRFRVFGYNNNATPEEINYVETIYHMDDITDGSEDGGIEFQTMVAGVDTTVMRIKDGNVGIGTAAPGYPLVVSTGDTSLVGVFSCTKASASNSGGFVILDSNDGAAMSSGDRLGGLLFRGYDGTVSYNAAGIAGFASGDWTDVSHPSHFCFETAGDSGGRTERMRIDKDGNVGINETSPQDKLEVNGRILVKDKICFTQDDRNEFIDSLGDGYMDYGATTQHRFNNDINVAVGKVYKVNNVQVLAAQQAHIVDANGTLEDITTKFNTLLSQLETHGINASA